MRKVLECLAVIIATLIGAGFASGREINSFFLQNGYRGYYGIMIVSIGWGMTIILLLFQIRSRGNCSYDAFIHHNKMMKGYTLLYSFCVFCVMISSVGALLEQEMGINDCYGIFCVEIICFCVFHYRFTLLQSISAIMVPFLIVGLFRVSAVSMVQSVENIMCIQQSNRYLIGTVLYYSYNMSLLLPILCTLSEKKLKSSEIIWMGGIATILMGWLMIRIFRVNSCFLPEILNREIPNIYIASLISKSFYFQYFMVLIGAIGTTALTARV